MPQEEVLTFTVPWIPKPHIEARALELVRQFDEAESAGLLAEAKGIDPFAYLEYLTGEERLTSYYVAELPSDTWAEYRFEDPALRNGGNSIILSRELTQNHPQWSFTIAHETAHLVEHHPLFEASRKQLPLLSGAHSGGGIRCFRKDLVLCMGGPPDGQRARAE